MSTPPMHRRIEKILWNMFNKWIWTSFWNKVRKTYYKPPTWNRKNGMSNHHSLYHYEFISASAFNFDDQHDRFRFL